MSVGNVHCLLDVDHQTCVQARGCDRCQGGGCLENAVRLEMELLRK